jgi:hypothetical protein
LPLSGFLSGFSCDLGRKKEEAITLPLAEKVFMNSGHCPDTFVKTLSDVFLQKVDYFLADLRPVPLVL